MVSNDESEYAVLATLVTNPLSSYATPPSFTHIFPKQRGRKPGFTVGRAKRFLSNFFFKFIFIAGKVNPADGPSRGVAADVGHRKGWMQTLSAGLGV